MDSELKEANGEQRLKPAFNGDITALLIQASGEPEPPGAGADDMARKSCKEQIAMLRDFDTRPVAARNSIKAWLRTKTIGEQNKLWAASGKLATDIGWRIEDSDASAEAEFEVPKQAVAGVLDAVNGLADLIDSALPAGGIIWDENGLRLVGSDELRAEREGGGIDDPLTLDPAQTTAGAIARGASQFLTGFLPLFRIARAAKAGNFVAGATAGAAAEFAAFKGAEENFADLWKKLELPENELADFLATHDDDSEVVKRFKNAASGALTGVALDSLMTGAKALRAWHRAGRPRPNVARPAALPQIARNFFGKGLTFKEMRNATKQYVRENLAGRPFLNEQTTTNIVVTNTSARKFVGHGKYPEQFVVAGILPDIIRTGIRKGPPEAPRRSEQSTVKAYHRFQSQVLIDDVPYDVRWIARE